MSTVVVCGECNDAPATRKTWFNGRTLMDLCDGCYDWWEQNGLIEPRDDAHFGVTR